ncbi:MAG: PQQ-like beta-propeller repeat protein [Candidatus Peribacteraceae bacterium]|nr:PQQ-like beta-propeller repeat protein [Candidatus Peribacteraceae bacterium]
MKKVIIVASIICIILLMNNIVQSQGIDNNSPPCYRLNPQHTGQSPYNAEHTTGETKWTYDVGNTFIRSHPVIDADGNLIFVTDEGTVHSLNSNGELNWKYHIGITSSNNGPAIGNDGVIYCGGGNNTLYALNPDGTLKWKYVIFNDTTNPVWVSAPVIDSNNIIYFGSTEPIIEGIREGMINALDHNGNLLWKYSLGEGFPVSPALGHNGEIYAGGRGGLFAFTSNGTQIWNVSFGSYGPLDVSIASDRMIYTTNGDLHIYAIYPNGTISWSYDIEDYSEGTPTINNDGNIYTVLANLGMFNIFNPNGTIESNWTISEYMISPITMSGDGIHFFSTSNLWTNCTIHALNPDGTTKWEFDAGKGSFSSPAVIDEDGNVYIAIENTMYAFGNDKPMPDVLIILGVFVVITVVSSGVIMLVRKRKNKLRDFNE